MTRRLASKLALVYAVLCAFGGAWASDFNEILVHDAEQNVVATCPFETARVGNTCVDRYEAPNQKGEHPFSGRTAYEGEQWCALQGKRLCTEDEWFSACEGSKQQRYPYGAFYEHGRCNDDKHWRVPDWKLIDTYPAPGGRSEIDRLYQADRSGSREGCVSEAGIYDLTGNVAEWVVRSYPSRTNYGHVLKGCFWAGCSNTAVPNCEFRNTAHPGSFRSYEAGFRCCVSVVP